ncbi:MAG: hypothetical protein GQ574_07185 [Crocinitomix sp.]|nr:hypothetical protein [Crocinitomix sp.]
MEERLKQISEKYNCEYKQWQGTYDLSFQIRNLPLGIITLEQDRTDFNLIARCEFLWGTSTAPSFLSGNNPDKYKFSITCQLTNSALNAFHIMEHDWFRRRVFGRDLSIKSKDKLLAAFLSENELIKDVYSFGKGSSELSPVIACYTKNREATININYQSFELNTDILDKSIEFCNQLENYKLN